MKRYWIALLPLLLLVMATMAQHISAPQEESAGFIQLGVHTEDNPERAALTALVRHLAGDPITPVTIAWSESVGGDGLVERRVTYIPCEQRLVTICAGQKFSQVGISEQGMRTALRNNDRHASFAFALVASKELPHKDKATLALGVCKGAQKPG